MVFCLRVIVMSHSEEWYFASASSCGHHTFKILLYGSASNGNAILWVRVVIHSIFVYVSGLV